MKGRCTCGEVSFELKAAPMFVHCCHCTWCQRETGTAFALNALIENANVEVSGETEVCTLPSASGGGQIVHRCPTCKVALWSHYSNPKIAFVRVGTLDEASKVAPDVHIYTTTKLPWVNIEGGAPIFEAYYKPRELWSAEAQARYRALLD